MRKEILRQFLVKEYMHGRINSSDDGYEAVERFLREKGTAINLNKALKGDTTDREERALNAYFNVLDEVFRFNDFERPHVVLIKQCENGLSPKGNKGQAMHATIIRAALDTPTQEDMRAILDAIRSLIDGVSGGFSLLRPLQGGRYVVGGIATVTLSSAALGAVSRKTVADILLDLAADPLTIYGAGAWRDSETGTVYLDTVATFETLREAIDFARERGEIAIFDLIAGDEIRL